MLFVYLMVIILIL